MKPDRKEFLKTALVIAGAGFGLANGIGCGSSSDTPGDAGGSTGGHGNGTGGSGSGGSSPGTGGAGSGGTTGSGGSGSGGSGSGGSGSGGSGSGGSGSGGSGSGGSGSGGSMSGSGGRNNGEAGRGGNAGRNGGGMNGSGTGGAGTAGAGGGGTGTNACDAHDPKETIETNHPPGSEHILMVTPAEVTAGVNKTYSIKGNSSHDHMVTITASDFTKLKAGMQYMMTSTVGGSHTHVVRVICA